MMLRNGLPTTSDLHRGDRPGQAPALTPGPTGQRGSFT
jgi:hypothetical protein